jgi:plasmid stabilization system protein ParE
LKRPTRFLTSAETDFVTIAWHIAVESNSAETGLEFVALLRRRCEYIATLSGTLGTARDELFPGLRSFPYRGYVVFFRYTAEAFEVVNVLHGRRDFRNHFVGDQ